MKIVCTIVGVLFLFVIVTLLASYICFRLAFYNPKPKKAKEEYPTPPGAVYGPFREQMIAWIKESRAFPSEDCCITSFDGLNLRGRYYEYAPGAPIELMLHGYRGESERDLSGGVQRCFALGRSALVVDQRSCGRSEGSVITFGIKEHRDCLSWIDFMLERFGSDTKIILTGISMGASTVLMAAACPLPPNVVGVLADCGFTSAPQIIKKILRQIHLPVFPFYPLIKLGAKLFGKFDLEENSAYESVQKTTLPTIFFHGEDDSFVPCYMSQENYDACNAPKYIMTVPGAGHGLSYPVAPEDYLRALRDFFDPVLYKQTETSS